MKNTEDDIVFVTEHRQTPCRFDYFQKRIRHDGYTPIAHPAVATGIQGASGGVAILARHRQERAVKVEPLDPGIYTSVGFTAVESSRVCGAILHTDRLRVLLIVVYLYHTEGLSERNQALLASIELLSRTVGLPTMIGGDLNFAREEIYDSLFFRSLNLCFLSSPEVTCEEGKGSCIDHLLAPVGFLNTRKYASVTPEGFRPHLVSRVYLSHRLRHASLAPHPRAPAAILPPVIFEQIAKIPASSAL